MGKILTVYLGAQRGQVPIYSNMFSFNYEYPSLRSSYHIPLFPCTYLFRNERYAVFVIVTGISHFCEVQ